MKTMRGECEKHRNCKNMRISKIFILLILTFFDFREKRNKYALSLCGADECADA